MTASHKADSRSTGVVTRAFVLDSGVTEPDSDKVGGGHLLSGPAI